jgi:hypothetical protein
MTMVEKITEFITAHPSYTKKSVKFLAKRFNCGERTIKKVLVNLQEVSKNYRLKK